MKQTLLLIGFAISSVFGFSQTVTSVHHVQVVSAADLANCVDSSSYFGDTVTVIGIVMHDGNLTEIPSGSTAGGYRAAIHLMDTATAGLGGDFKGIQIHGVFNDGTGNQPVSSLNSLIAGDSVEITGVVGRYQGETQIYPLDNSSVSVLPTPGVAPMPRVVSVGDLNDNNRVNQLTTGEALEGSLVMLNNVTVTSVNFFSGGSRVSIDVTDASGNTINVSDRFLVQKLPGHTTVNPGSPQSNGSFVAPPVGLVYDTLIGIILHSENGCTGSNGRGYEINPFASSHYVIGATPPSITNAMRAPIAPKSTEVAAINCNVIDFDGTVASVKLFYTDNIMAGMFDSLDFTQVGATDEFTADVPMFADGKMIGYYIKAVDNAGNVSQYPATPAGSASENVSVYTVRDNGLTIVDIQKVLDLNDDESYYTGMEVTVTGVVSASAKDFDLGYVYIQQAGATEWAGLSLIGNSDLVLLLRTEEVTVTGIIEEYYNFTRMVVTNVVKTGNVIPNEVTYFDPSDDAMYTSGEIEKLESMLVGMENGTTGLFMTDEDRGFGDYEVGTSAAAARSTRVTAGRQTGSAFSSLWVSLVSSGYYWDNDGQMEVDTVITTIDMQIDTLSGIMYYGFGNFKLMPRNNDDIMGLSENGTPINLDSTNLSLPTGIVEINGKTIETTIYPNPASSNLTVSVNGMNGAIVVSIFDLGGRLVSQSNNNSTVSQINVGTLQNGVYLMRVTDVDGNQLAIEKIVIKH